MPTTPAGWARARVAACALPMVLMLAAAPHGSAGASPWLDGARPSAQAMQAVELLTAAGGHGLDPRDYDAPELRQAVAQAGLVAPADPAAAERLAQALDRAMQRYLRDLHQGRVDPLRLDHDFTPPRRAPYDAAAVLSAALAAHRLDLAVADAAPQLPQYGQLRDALARYRALADHPAWRQPLPPLPSAPDRRRAPGKLEPGGDYAGLALLAGRLVALGDLDGEVPLPARFDGALVEALRSFQRRHGLADDGVIGPATLARLQVPPQARARQIELSLERLRWTPLMQGPRMVVINVPEFVLRAYSVRDGRIQVEHEMKIIVGKALDTRTPLFDEAMRYIEFSPYWNVPPSIARGEIVPRLRRDPAYFEREGFEFVAGGRVDPVLTTQRIDELAAGRVRIRQRPGPRNALGDIKFVFPNRSNIYLHHTPSTSLFERDRRDFSHGCIRVEQPVALARFVLGGMPGWTDERIRQAMGRRESATLALSEPVPVLIAYGTALVRQGRPHFFDDLYGHDRRLDAALRQRQREPLPADRPTPPIPERR